MNWTENTLTILAPPSTRARLLEALSGPDDWPMPGQPLPPGETPPKMSAHARLRLSRAPRVIAAEIRAAWGGDWPDWIPVGRDDLARHCAREHPRGPSRVALSLPRLAPWRDLREFHGFFPGDIDSDGIWDAAMTLPSSLSWGFGSIALRCHKIGQRWPPARIAHRAPRTCFNRTAGDLVRFDTVAGPIENLADILAPVMTDHNACALNIWRDKAGHSGFDLIAASGHSERHAFEHGAFGTEEPDGSWSIDADALQDGVRERVDETRFFDPDPSP